MNLAQNLFSNSELRLEKSSEAFTASCLIPFNENSGLHLIEIAEVLYQIAVKLIIYIAKKYIHGAAGTL